MPAYYNEIEPYAAQWLRNLIAAGHIAPGDVDERNIVDVRPDDLKGYTQVHLFAGIGGWSLAAKLAGWNDDRPLWTGSCPCQPFSAAGKREGIADERHLWPEMYRLVRECRPSVVAGEQVGSQLGLGWLDGVFADLENAGYACGAADLCAAGVGAPHIRQRLFWVAHTQEGRWREQRNEMVPRGRGHIDGGGNTPSWVANTTKPGSQGGEQSWERPDPQRQAAERGSEAGFWAARDWIPCRDGKVRAVEPGTFPLATGVPSRVGRLRAYGNAISPQAAAEVLKAIKGHFAP